jgi:hypothetical protein
VTRFVTTVMGVVIGLTFLFGFGNVLALALRIGVPAYVAPLVAPAVDLTVLGLLVGTRHLALCGAPDHVLQPARRLLLAASAVTLALNVADPVCAGQWGRAAFDSVGPLLLIGWAVAGPGLLQAIGATRRASAVPSAEEPEVAGHAVGRVEESSRLEEQIGVRRPESARERTVDVLLAQARREDAAHRVAHQRPISAETLRVQIGVGAARARRLVKVIRAEFQQRVAAQQPAADRRG